MPDSNVVAARMTVDIADFQSGMANLADSAKTSLDQITSQLSAIRGASNQTSVASTEMASDIKQALESIASMAERSATRYNAAQRLAAAEEKRRTEEAKAAATTIAAQASVVVAGIAQEMESTKQLAATYKAWAPVQIQLSRQAATEAVANSNAQIAASQSTVAAINSLALQSHAAAQVQISANSSTAAQVLATGNVLVSANQAQIANYRMLGQQATATSSQIVSANNAQAASARAAAQQAASAAQVQVASLNQQTQVIRLQIAQLQQSGQANSNHASSVGVNSTAIREFLVVMREAARGDTTRMVGSLSILAQQFEFTAGVIRTLFNPYLLALEITVGALGFAWIKGKNDAAAFTNAMQLSGNVAGLTASSYQKMAEKLSGPLHISNQQAKDAILQVAAAGVFTKNQIEQLTEAAVIYGKKSGESTEDSLKKFIKLKDGASKALIDLKKEANDLVDSGLINMVKGLEESGQKSEAAQVAITALQVKLKGMSDTTNVATKAWDDFWAATSNRFNRAVKSVSGTFSDGEKLDNAKAKEKELQDTIKTEEASRFSILSAGYINEKKAELAKIQQTILTLTKSVKDEEEKAQKIAAAQVEKNAKYNATLEIQGQHLKANKTQMNALIAAQERLYSDAEKGESKARVAELERMKAEKIADIRKDYEENPSKPKGAATQSQIVRNELLDELVIKERAAIASGKIYTQRLQDTVKFYEDEASIIRTRKGATKADIMRVDNQLLAARLAVDKESQNAKIAYIQHEINDRSKGYDEQIRLATKFKNDLFDASKPKDDPANGKLYQSKEYYDASDVEKNKKEKGLEESLRIQQEEYKGYATIELEKLDDLKASYKLQLTEHQINLKAYLALMRQEAADELKIKEKLIDDEMALERQKDGGGDPVKLKQLENQKLLAGRQSNKELLKNSQDAARDYMKPWDDAWKHMGSSFASQIEKVIKGQHNLGQAFRYTIGDMVLYGAKEMEQWAFKQLKFYAMDLLGMNKAEVAKTASLGIHTQARVGVQAAGSAQGVGIKAAELPVHFGIETAKTGATAVGEETRVGLQAAGSAEGLAIKAAAAISQIAMDAWTAMAGAYAAIAAIPYVGPVLAPVAAGAAFAGVIKIGSNIASASGGYDIPHGVNPVTQLHQDEMVLPAPIANTVRNAMSNGGSRGSGGTIHIHQNIYTPNGDSFRKSATQIQRETKRKMAMI